MGGGNGGGHAGADAGSHRVAVGQRSVGPAGVQQVCDLDGEVVVAVGEVE
ncbi:hypothetical protein AB0L34_29825 [Micromonospora sp. NPDC052213]